MSYIQSNLLSNEKMVYFTRMHWIVFATPIFFLLIAIIVSLSAPQLFPGQLPFLNIPLWKIVSVVLLVAAIFSSLQAVIRYLTSEYGVTTKRILLKTGWISRNSLELFLDKVEAINVDQSILGRILGYGTLRVVGTGGTQDLFFYVPDPLSFRKKAQQQVDITENK